MSKSLVFLLKLNILVLSVIACVNTAAAQTLKPFEACDLETHKDTHSKGRFIWKPIAAHFSRQAVIVAPRYYFPRDLKVELFSGKGRKIETARLKSTGICPENPECLFASTYLTAHDGAFYQRHYNSIFVRITPESSISSLACRYYSIPHPKRRAEFRG